MLYRMKDAKPIKLGFNPFAKGFTDGELKDAFYRLTCDPKQHLLILESCSLEEADGEYGGDEPTCDGCTADCASCGMKRDDGMVLEAVRVRAFSRTTQTMAALQRSLNKYMADKGLTVGDAVVGKPKKSGLFATVTVQFPVSDGQTITIIFHSPDGNKLTITAADEILAFRWLLNKRDITVAVAPEGEADVSLEEVGKRVAMLVEKNSKAFQSKSKEIADQKGQLADLTTQVATAQGEVAALQADYAEMEQVSSEIDGQIEQTTAQLSKVQEFNAGLQQKISELQATKAGNDGKGAGGRPADWEINAPYDEDYTGPRFKYGFQNRPYSFATAPKGAILGSYKENDKPENSKGKARYGTIEYPFPLTDDEIRSYELLDLTGRAEVAEAEAYRQVQNEFRDELVGRGFTDGSTEEQFLCVINIGGELLKARIDNYSNIGYTIVAGTEATAKSFGPTKSLTMFSDRAVPKALDYIDQMIGKMQKQAPLPKDNIDPTSPDGYAQVMADPELQLKYQDVLDAFFQTRIPAIRVALRPMGWESNMKDPKLAFQSQKTVGQTTYWVSNDYVQVGSGANVVGITAKIQSTTGYGEELKVGNDILILDDLTTTPEEFAAKINGSIPSEKGTDIGKTYFVVTKGINEDTTKEFSSLEAAETYFTQEVETVKKTAAKGTRVWVENLAGDQVGNDYVKPGTPDTSSTNPDEYAAVTTLNDIVAGKYGDSGSISDALDDAAAKLEGAGLMETYDVLLNQAADYLTEVLKKEAA